MPKTHPVRSRSYPSCPAGKGKIKKVMREYGGGTLHSGGSGKNVHSRKQAVAIALSEARRACRKGGR